MPRNVTQPLNPIDYYRLPWSLTDNVLAWLEPTKRCNLSCEGCYSRNDPNSDKTLDQVRADLEVFVRHRRVDSISIAGGDPLVHPQIVDIVRMIRHEFGLKPVINTNGLALTPELLRDLHRAGNHGFTFHIDSSQNRPGWKGKNELELNELRLYYARMAAEVGASVAFNSTVFRHTLHYVPELMNWACDHIDLVHSMVFILFRTSCPAEHDYYAFGRQVDVRQLVYEAEEKNPDPITADEVVGVIRESQPDYEPCAYLGGTHNPRSFKWLLAGRIGRPGKIHGYVGRRWMELVQTGHHLLFNRYLGYGPPSLLSTGRSMALLGAALDPGARKVLRSYVSSLLRSPQELLSNLHFQSILIIQPIDFMADGTANMCDGCPDITVHEGELVWSCRLEERLRHGCFLQAVPKSVSVRDGKRHLRTIPPEAGDPEREQPAASEAS